jgi:3-oxoacyl-(acyl-carrier-protein) synthase
MRAASEAWRSAGFSGTAEPPGLRLGIVVGTSVGASLDFYSLYVAYKAGKSASGSCPERTDGVRGDDASAGAVDGVPPAEIEAYLGANPAQALGEIFRCSGPAVSVADACSSGADAVGIGAGWIRSGLCDLVLAGGADALSYITYVGFACLRLPSPSVCRPFDRRRDGLTLGEGAGFMLLETEASRRRRGVKAVAFAAGYGTAADAYHLTAPHPEGRGLALAVDQALAQAGLRMEDMAFINAHGTATAVNDAAEAAFFTTRCPGIPVIATKGATGHTLGAAGAVEAVLSAAHLAAGSLPATPNFREPDPALGVRPVSALSPVRGRAAMSLSLAFGGNNSALVLTGGEQ